jgi:hypothetical protein
VVEIVTSINLSLNLGNYRVLIVDTQQYRCFRINEWLEDTQQDRYFRINEWYPTGAKTSSKDGSSDKVQ